MVNSKSIQNVQIMCKSMCTLSRKTLAKLCANYKKFVHCVQNPNFPTIFSSLSHHLLHSHPISEKPGLFHFFTAPTITTIIN